MHFAVVFLNGGFGFLMCFAHLGYVCTVCKIINTISFLEPYSMQSIIDQCVMRETLDQGSTV